MNLVYAASAYPFGHLSDRMSHKRLLLWGLAMLIAADLVLAQVSGAAGVLLGVALWGVHMGMTQGLLASMVAAVAPFVDGGISKTVNAVGDCSPAQVDALLRQAWHAGLKGLTVFRSACLRA